MIKRFRQNEEGQGLVEYALILVLVAIVVIAVLLQLGPEIRLAFGRVTAVLQGAGVITSSGAISDVGASYSAGGFGNPAQLTVTVTVSSDTTVTLSGDGGLSANGPCNGGTCTFTFNNPPSTGSVVVTDGSGGQGVVAYW